MSGARIRVRDMPGDTYEEQMVAAEALAALCETRTKAQLRVCWESLPEPVREALRTNRKLASHAWTVLSPA